MANLLPHKQTLYQSGEDEVSREKLLYCQHKLCIFGLM